MTLLELFIDKTTKPKEKIVTISDWLLDGSLPIEELVVFAEKAKDSDKASCIESIEFATKQNAKIADENVLIFVTKSLDERAPRIKWESAKVIGNIAHLFSTNLNKTIEHLLNNARHDGTVVRWAPSYALGEIIKLKTKHNTHLIPTIESMCGIEENNGVKKKYLDALKKLKK
ncbi:MAG TPA: hypothetical protein PLD02_00775 [Saprospiraceae bacterium]|nr:hypothetical protein [Saprospiraceae bacterium]